MTFINKLFKKDDDGKYNRPALVFVAAIITLPLVIIEGVKTGLYDRICVGKVGLQVLLEGLMTPFVKVISMKNNAAFGSNVGGFNPEYLVILFLLWSFIFALSFIEAERRQRLSRIKDGDAKWADKDAFNKKFAYPQQKDGFEEPEEDSEITGNMITSQNTRYALEPKGTNTWSCNCIVGATGSGKSYHFVKPNILQMNSSFVVTDPKGELAADVGKALMNHGYDVKVFNTNPDELQYSCRYNPFAYVRTPEDVDTLIDVFLKNVKDPDAKPDSFFDSAEKNFLGALFHFVYESYKDTEPEKMTFKTVYELFLECKEVETNPRQGPAPKSAFKEKFEALGARNPYSAAYGHFAIYDNGTAKTKQSILATVGNEFAFMNTPTVANLLSCDASRHVKTDLNGKKYLVDDLRLDLVGDRKTAIFVIIPSVKKTYNFLAALLFSQLFTELYRVAETVNAKSWILYKGMTTAIKSRVFVPGTDDELKAKEELEQKRQLYLNAYIEEDDEEKLPLNSEGVRVWPKTRIVCEHDGEKIVLEEFTSRKQAELVLDAAKTGKIERWGKNHVCHVRFILDEFFNIGKISDFDNIIATCRSLRISTDIILQSISQLQDMYDDKEGKITSNCTNTIILGTNDGKDGEWASDLIGQTTVVSESINLDHNGMGGASGGSLSENAQQLIRPEQVRKLDTDYCLIISSSQNPIKDKKYNSVEHPRWKETKDSHNKDTFCNEFPYRRIFYIEQDDSNRAVTAKGLSQIGTTGSEVQKALPHTAKDDSFAKGPDAREIERKRRQRLLTGHNRNNQAYEEFKNRNSIEKSISRAIESSPDEDNIKIDSLDERIKSRIKKSIENGDLTIDKENKKVKSTADLIDEL